MKLKNILQKAIFFYALIPIIDDINAPQIKVIINQFENLDK